jgi:hypothetical protein
VAEYQPTQYSYSGVQLKPVITVTGLKEAIDMLEGLPKGLVAEGFARALDEAGEVFQDEVQRRTPIRKASKSGWNPEAFKSFDWEVVTGTTLAESVRRRITIDSQYRGGRVEIYHKGMDHVALWLEYGHEMVTHYAHSEDYTDKRGKKRKRKWGGHERIGTVPAYPFIRPAAEAAYTTAVERFVSSLTKTVDAYQAKFVNKAA